MDEILRPFGNIAKRLRGTPRIKADYFGTQITRLHNLGFNLATEQMIEYFEQIDPSDDNWGSGVTREQVGNLVNRPWYGMYTHDRSQRIDSAIDYLAEHFDAEISEGTAWLLPVYDDEEYISWVFEVAVGTEEEVTEQIRKTAGVITVEVPI